MSYSYLEIYKKDPLKITDERLEKLSIKDSFGLLEHIQEIMKLHSENAKIIMDYINTHTNKLK
jgi:hypothetical protein